MTTSEEPFGPTPTPESPEAAELDRRIEALLDELVAQAPPHEAPADLTARVLAARPFAPWEVRHGWAIPPALASLAPLLPAPPVSAEEAGAPLAIESATRRAGDLVALGRAIELDGELDGVLVAIGGTVHIRGRVAGDAILLFARAELDGAARVDGDLLVVGGDLRFAGGATARAVLAPI